MTPSSPSDPADELAAELGRLVREREAAELDARPPEWDAALAGELDFDEALARRRAAGEPEPERAAAVFRPFGADETAALVDGLLASVAREHGNEGLEDARLEDARPEDAGLEDARPEDAGPEDARLGPPEGPLAEVIPLGERRPSTEAEASGTNDAASSDGAAVSEDTRSGAWWIPGGMLVAAAAAIVLWWMWPPSDDVRGSNTPQIAQLEPLPTYGLEADGGLAKLRGDDPPAGEPARYHRDTQFTWLMRPEVDVSETVDVRGFVFASGGTAGLPLALEPLTQRAASGVIRVTGEISKLDLEPGRYTIVLAVGRPDDLPTQAAQVATPEPEGAWQVHRVDIHIED